MSNQQTDGQGNAMTEQAENDIGSESVSIECKNLWKIYGRDADKALPFAKSENLGKDEILSRFGCVLGVVDASFQVNRGEIFCIMGLSGSGKSTLIRNINRLIEPTAGQIFINGIDIAKLNTEELRDLRSKKMGMVFQNMALLPYRTVLGNVGFGLELRKVEKKQREEAAEKALDLVHLSEWINHYPEELSGGMQQRVGLARALASDPDILLMDEPFSALDPLIRRQLQDQFLELSAKLKKTTLFITHDLDEAIRLGNHIAIMKDGKLVQIGVPEEIVTNPADDYVADFVAGISRLHIVKVHTVMFPIDFYRKEKPDIDVENLSQVNAESELNQVVEIMVEKDEGKIAAVDGDGKVVGIVTRRSLLRGMQGKNIEALNPE